MNNDEETREYVVVIYNRRGVSPHRSSYWFSTEKEAAQFELNVLEDHRVVATRRMKKDEFLTRTGEVRPGAIREHVVVVEFKEDKRSLHKGRPVRSVATWFFTQSEADEFAERMRLDDRVEAIRHMMNDEYVRITIG